MNKPTVPFFNHDLGQEELDAIAEVFRGPILTTGDVVHRFERTFSDYLGVRSCLGLTSCTGGLHLSLLALGIGPGDEVITTPATFVATALAILEAGAKPVFVDVEPDTGNLDAEKVEAAITPRTRAIMPVHLYGLMCDMRRLKEIADRHGLRIVEDAAHAIESVRDGVRPGQLGDTACFSFFATKNITCGEGGAVAGNDESLFARLKLLRLHGMNKTADDRFKEGYQHWDVDRLGWKYNMDNIQAAMLLPQMRRLQKNLEKRQALAQAYEAALAEVEGVRPLATRAGAVHARHLFPVRVKQEIRDGLIEKLKHQGIPVVVNYRAIHRLTLFREAGYRAGMFPEAERLGDEAISLPLFPAMPPENVATVVAGIKRAMT